MKLLRWTGKQIFYLVRWCWRYGIRFVFYGVFIIMLLPRSTPLTNDLWLNIAYEISNREFDYIGWEVDALLAKTGQTLFGVQPFMDETARSTFVREYMADLARTQTLEAQINTIYTDPAIEDPALASEELRAERDPLRAKLRANQLLAEAILEGQVAALLVEEGFGTAGQLMPPLSMHFTEVPLLLVISPRDRIAMDVSLNLYALPLDELVTLEQRIEQQYDVSALITPIGGIALYPAMITETASVQRAAEVFAHEWLHHYLFFYPLGINYFTGGEAFASETRILNETSADLFGKEMARRVLERYYPDLEPPEAPPAPNTTAVPAEPTEPAEPPAFDFGAEMNETRVTVDELLAAGKVEAAETYMEERRALFYENGYRFRRINQAFFAFYGGYQGGAVPGVGGEDPIGPALRTIRQNSASLYEFVVTVRGIISREQVVAAAQTK